MPAPSTSASRPSGSAIWPVIPALRWSRDDGFGLRHPPVPEAVDRGAPGFILFGGTAEDARAAAEALAAPAGRPLLLGADLERGAGQQFSGATPLPPAAALAWRGDREVLRAAGELTAREARALGVPWIFAPVADVALDPENPIVSTRAFGVDPAEVAGDVAAWVEGCLAGGGIPCLKHFPGHGRTRTDSHRELPVVEATRAELLRDDLPPFRAGLAAGAPSVMTAHVAFPALDPSSRPATRSGSILQGLLREALGFRGVVVSDALVMEGAGRGPVAARESLAAGVDLLLYPGPEVDPPHLAGAAARRVRALWARVRPLAEIPPVWGRREDGARAWRWAVEALVPPGTATGPGQPVPTGAPGDTGTPWQSEAPWAAPPAADEAPAVRVHQVDDDVGGPYPPHSREALPAELRRRGIRVSVSPAGGEDGAGAGSGRRRREEGPGSAELDLLVVFADPRAWKGRAGLSDASRAAVQRWRTGVAQSGKAPLAVVCGGPRVAAELPGDLPRLLAWGGEPLMQRAAAAWLAERLGGPPAREGNALDGADS